MARSDEANAILWALTAVRDALEDLARQGDFHAKVTLHHFFQVESEKKWEAMKKTAGISLIEKSIKNAKQS